MASEKKIMMFDESTGMLSMEVMTAYINNELSPSLREDVENFLAKDEMHRDIIEGLRLVRDKTQSEKAIHAINEQIASRTGAEVRSGGVSFEMPEGFTDYRKIAAIAGGILVVAGVIFTLMLLKPSLSGIASREDDMAQKKEEAPPPEASTAQEKTTEPVEESTTEMPADTYADSVVSEPDSVTASLEVAAGANVVADAADRKDNPELAAEERRLRTAANKSKEQEKSVPDAGAGIAGVTAPAAVSDDISSAESNVPAADTATALQNLESRMAMVPVEQAPAANIEMPEFPGGEAGLRKYIRDNLIYPDESEDNRVQGKVELEFYVGTTGRVKNIRVTKGVNKEINTEAVRLIANMPKWKPGKLDGKPATLQKHLTIDFTID